MYSGHLFVFVSRKGDRVKILTFSRGGFVLYYKRLETGRFQLPPVDAEAQAVQLDATQLTMLLDGILMARRSSPLHARYCAWGLNPRPVQYHLGHGHQPVTRRWRSNSLSSASRTTRGTLTWVGEPPRRTSTSRIAWKVPASTRCSTAAPSRS